MTMFAQFAILASSRQEDVLKSISENVSQSDGLSNRTMLAIVLGLAAIIMLIALFNSRGKRIASPKPVNHNGKLIRELSKQIGLKPAELKQLKLLAQGERDAGNPVDNPLVFMLCPSAFVKAAKAKRARIDRRIMTNLARKLGLTPR